MSIDKQVPGRGRATGPSLWASPLLRWVRLFVGLGLFSAGLALMVRADLGLSSWDVLHDGLTRVASITLGQAIIAVSAAVVMLSTVLGVRPGPGTVANIVLVGVFTDGLLASSLVQGLHEWNTLTRATGLVTGVLTIALGTGLYIGAGLGAGPRDSLMLALSNRFRVSVGRARTMLEIVVVGIGVAAGGRAGIGTVAFALLIGPAINAAFAVLGLDQPAQRRTGLIRRLTGAATVWLGRRQPPADEALAVTRCTGARR